MRRVRQRDRQRHQLGGLGAGIAEHHALVARADGLDGVVVDLAAAHLQRVVDAQGDVGRLLVDRRHHAAGIGVEAVLGLGVADAGQGAAHDLGDLDVALPW